MTTRGVRKHPKAELGLQPEQLDGVVQILNRLLADEIVLYAKTRDFHWNIIGPQFHDFHKLFEHQYEELATIGDEVAERARALGGPALGSLGEALRQTQLKEDAEQHTLPALDMVENLLEDYQAVIRHLRGDIEACCDKFHDEGTANFLTDLIEKHEKTAWMLRATLEEH